MCSAVMSLKPTKILPLAAIASKSIFGSRRVRPYWPRSAITTCTSGSATAASSCASRPSSVPPKRWNDCARVVVVVDDAAALLEPLDAAREGGVVRGAAARRKDGDADFFCHHCFSKRRGKSVRRHLTARMHVDQGKQPLDQLGRQVVPHAFDDFEARARHQARGVDAAGQPAPADRRRRGSPASAARWRAAARCVRPRR